MSKTSRKCSKDFSIGIDESNETRKRGLTNIEKDSNKGKLSLRFCLGSDFGCPGQQEKVTYSLGYMLLLKRNNVVNILIHAFAFGSVAEFVRAAIDAATIVPKGRYIRIDISWYVPNYSLKTVQYAILSKQLISRVPAEISNTVRSVLNIHVIAEKKRSFELGLESGKKMPSYVIVGVLQKIGSGHQYSLRDVFC